MSFSENLSKIQTERGETNYRLAKEIGVKQTTIANWKAGKTKPLMVYAEKLADHFGVTVDELLGTSEKEG